MAALVDDPAIVHDQDQVCVLNGGDALRNDQLCRAGNLAAESSTDARVRLGIHRRGGVVQDQDLRFFQKRSGDAQPLLLPAGDIRAALLDIGIVFLGEALDKFIRLQASLQIRSSSSSLASALPQRRFSRMVPENSTFFCRTTAT